MSKKRLEEIKEKYMPIEYDFNLKAVDINCLIEKAEVAHSFAKKNAELNEFLNEYSEAEHWGQNVIDVAMDIITKQDKQIEELKDDKIELYKLNAKIGVKAWDIEQQNKRYREENSDFRMTLHRIAHRSHYLLSIQDVEKMAKNIMEKHSSDKVDKRIVEALKGDSE